MTGNRSAHPLLLTLANLELDFRSKSSNHAFLLLSLIPIPQFIERNQKLHGVLENRLFHECLDIILNPLKKAAEFGIMLQNALGSSRHFFTPLAAYIVDTPEAALIACVGGKTSPFTMASYKNFGDNFRHPPRTGARTLKKLRQLKTVANPSHLKEYIKVSSATRLNGVHKPFWRDWPMADPATFLTPEPLHHWFKEFWDHDVKWCINLVGSMEIDFRFSVLPPHTGFRHFTEGISKLKQVTGREHRDIQRYIVAIIAGAAPPKFVIAIRALVDFRYRAQAPEIDDIGLTRIQDALDEFHANKQIILDKRARRGKKDPIKNWYIPKLELMQSVVPSIRLNGVAIQWSADATEHEHVVVIKTPTHTTSNQAYEEQICRHLDRAEKCRLFSLTTSIQDQGLTLSSQESGDAGDIGSTQHLLSHLGSNFPGQSRITDYFNLANDLLLGKFPDAPKPFRTIAATSQSAIHLNRDPTFRRKSIEEVSQLYGLDDLQAALSNYYKRIGQDPTAQPVVGGTRTRTEPLPIDFVDVWTRVRIQNKGFHFPHGILPSQTIRADPPTDEWPKGRLDTVIFNTDTSKSWPRSGLEGMKYECRSTHDAFFSS